MEVNFDVHTTNYFPTDQTMYIFTRANVMIIYGDGYIKVEGRWLYNKMNFEYWSIRQML